jgi:hypothetical protein
MKIDWIAKLRHLLQTMAFCLSISALQYAFRPEQPYHIPLVYSLAIGTASWFFIDFGRHLLTGGTDVGWPTGIGALALPVVGIILGWLIGTFVADSVFGWSSWSFEARDKLAGSILVSLIGGGAISYYFYSRTKNAWLESKMREARQHATESRLKLLEAQLEPHMLFNTLANLRVLISTDPPRAVAMLDRLNSYLRATLTGSRTLAHPLAAEFDRLGDYLALMSVRMGTRLRYTLDLPDALRDVQVPPLLLQPLVENSIRHGLEPQVEGGEIIVRARREGTLLLIEVGDSGVGIDGAPLPPTAGGFGLSQVRERLATVYGEQSAMTLTARPAGGTCATLSFPLPA